MSLFLYDMSSSYKDSRNLKVEELEPSPRTSNGKSKHHKASPNGHLQNGKQSCSASDSDSASEPTKHVKRKKGKVCKQCKVKDAPLMEDDRCEMCSIGTEKREEVSIPLPTVPQAMIRYNMRVKLTPTTSFGGKCQRCFNRDSNVFCPDLLCARCCETAKNGCTVKAHIDAKSLANVHRKKLSIIKQEKDQEGERHSISLYSWM